MTSGMPVEDQRITSVNPPAGQGEGVYPPQKHAGAVGLGPGYVKKIVSTAIQ